MFTTDIPSPKLPYKVGKQVLDHSQAIMTPSGQHWAHLGGSGGMACAQAFQGLSHPSALVGRL